jgi:hypothetical protein
LAFFRFQGILYTKIGIDELDELKTYMFKLMQDYFTLIDREEVSKKEDINKIIHISLCMIFCAHATIAEAIKDVQKQQKTKKTDEEDMEQVELDELSQALTLALPQMALIQISTLLSLILDRISSIPSPWLEALIPLSTWLTLHKGDALLDQLFSLNP